MGFCAFGDQKQEHRSTSLQSATERKVYREHVSKYCLPRLFFLQGFPPALVLESESDNTLVTPLFLQNKEKEFPIVDNHYHSRIFRMSQNMFYHNKKCILNSVCWLLLHPERNHIFLQNFLLFPVAYLFVCSYLFPVVTKMSQHSAFHLEFSKESPGELVKTNLPPPETLIL